MGREDMSPEEIDEAADHGLVRACVKPELPDWPCPSCGVQPTSAHPASVRWPCGMAHDLDGYTDTCKEGPPC